MERIALVSLDLELTGEQVVTRAKPVPDRPGSGSFAYRTFGGERIVYAPNSILSMGACVVANIRNRWEVVPRMFYREIKPISDACTMESMRIACLGLECKRADDFLQPGDDPAWYDPHAQAFLPERFLERMRATTSTQAPERAIPELEEYLHGVHQEYGLPILAASPIVFDGKHLDFYFALFGTDRYRPHPSSKSPLGYGGIDIGSVLRGKANDLHAHLDWLGMRAKDGLTHKSSEDAYQQAEELVAVANADPQTIERLLIKR